MKFLSKRFRLFVWGLLIPLGLLNAWVVMEQSALARGPLAQVERLLDSSESTNFLYGVILILVWLLAPLIPAILIYRLFPSSEAFVEGPLQGLKVNAGGAIAGYVILLLLSLILVQPTFNHVITPREDQVALAELTQLFVTEGIIESPQQISSFADVEPTLAVFLRQDFKEPWTFRTQLSLLDVDGHLLSKGEVVERLRRINPPSRIRLDQLELPLISPLHDGDQFQAEVLLDRNIKSLSRLRRLLQDKRVMYEVTGFGRSRLISIGLTPFVSSDSGEQGKVACEGEDDELRVSVNLPEHRLNLGPCVVVRENPPTEEILQQQLSFTAEPS